MLQVINWEIAQLIAVALDRFHQGALPRYGSPLPGARGPISKEELRLRNWYWDKYLSGDILVDQNIHVIDMCNWILKAHPVNPGYRRAQRKERLGRLLGPLRGKLHLPG